MKVLITGFEPFGGEIVNPSYEAVNAMKDNIAEATIIKAQLPTVFIKSHEKLLSLIQEHNPQIVICIGQSGGRTGVTPERIAINIDDARIPDNDGNKPVDTSIFSDGNAAYFCTLPIKAMTQAMRDKGLPASVSNSAGTYVCNHIAYSLMYFIDKKFPQIRGGFIHVPYVTCQVVDKTNVASMSLNDITHCLEIAVETTINVKSDIVVSDSDTH